MLKDTCSSPLAESAQGPRYATKTCPQCGQELFADMDVCYGCLYDFGRELRPRHGALGEFGPLAKEDTERLSFPTDPAHGEASAQLRFAGRSSLAAGERGLFVQTGDMDVTVPLTPRGIVVGRAPTNDVVLHSRAVSRYQLRILPSEAGAHAEDLGATNPALIKGREIGSAVELVLGDTVNVCGTLMTLVEGTPEVPRES